MEAQADGQVPIRWGKCTEATNQIICVLMWKSEVPRKGGGQAVSASWTEGRREGRKEGVDGTGKGWAEIHHDTIYEPSFSRYRLGSALDRIALRTVGGSRLQSSAAGGRMPSCKTDGGHMPVSAGDMHLASWTVSHLQCTAYGNKPQICHDASAWPS
jgi:hypothetical protein